MVRQIEELEELQNTEDVAEEMKRLYSSGRDDD